jgi:hypothetical protein
MNKYLINIIKLYIDFPIMYQEEILNSTNEIRKSIESILPNESNMYYFCSCDGGKWEIIPKLIDV